MIDIERLLPEYITAKLGDYSFIGEKIGNKYIIKETVDDNIDIDEVDIYVNDQLFDRVNKQIILRQGDILNLEYEIDVEQ